MVSLIKAGGLILGLAVVGAIVVGIGLGGRQLLSRSAKVQSTASSSTPGVVSKAAIPTLDAEAPSDVATATFALG